MERNWLRKVTKTTEKIRHEVKTKQTENRKRPAEIIKVKRIESVTDRSDWLRDSDGMIYRKIKKSSFKMTNQAKKRDRKGGMMNVGRSRPVFKLALTRWRSQRPIREHESFENPFSVIVFGNQIFWQFHIFRKWIRKEIIEVDIEIFMIKLIWKLLILKDRDQKNPLLN